MVLLSSFLKFFQSTFGFIVTTVIAIFIVILLVICITLLIHSANIRMVIEYMVMNSNKLTFLINNILSNKIDEEQKYYYGILTFDKDTFIPIEILSRKNNQIIKLQNMKGKTLIKFDIYDLKRIANQDNTLFDRNDTSYLNKSLMHYAKNDTLSDLKQLRNILKLINNELMATVDINSEPTLIGPLLIGFWAINNKEFKSVYMEYVKTQLTELVNKENNIIEFISRHNIPEED